MNIADFKKTGITLFFIHLSCLSLAFFFTAGAQNSTPDQTERSAEMYRILNAANIRYVSATNDAFRLLNMGEKTDAGLVCKQFLSEMETLRSDLPKHSALTPDDIRYVSRCLLRLTGTVSDILENIPPG
jgi:hypothetical protein